MNLIVTTPKQSSFPGLVGRLLARLSRTRPTRAKRRYVDISEFSPHLQRDMGFMDGHDAPGSEGRRDMPDLKVRDWMR